MKMVVASLLCALALPVAAQETEQLLLPVEPSVTHCANFAEFVTRLVVYNPNRRSVRLQCAGDACGEVSPAAGRAVEGAESAAYPTFLYLPKSDAADVGMSLIVESTDMDHSNRELQELPIARTSDFRDSKLTLVGLRMEPGYRQALRIFGLDGTFGEVMVRAYDLSTNALLYEEEHLLWPLTDERTADGRPLRPSMSLECDLFSEMPELNGQYVRLEIEPITPGYRIWSFISVTNNKTQHFYTIVPR